MVLFFLDLAPPAPAPVAPYVGSRKIGQVAGCWWRLGEKRHRGLRDLVAIWRLGCCEYQPTRESDFLAI